MEESNPTNCESLVHSRSSKDALLRKVTDLQDPVDFIEKDSASHDQKSNLSAEGLEASSGKYLDEQELLEQKAIEDGRTHEHHHHQSAPFDVKQIKTHQSVSLDIKQIKTLCKYSTFPCSEEVQACCNIKREQETSGVEEQDRSIMKSAGPVYARSMSLPASVELVSAMKGGRERSGESPKRNLYVKWAEEVYDPPCSSLSHTVRNHPQRRKARKKDKERYKHKQQKNKPSKGISNEKKDKAHKLIGNLSGSTYARVQSTADRSLLDKCGCSDVEVLDYAAGSGQESKCGSTFIRESLAKMHISLAGAS